MEPHAAASMLTNRFLWQEVQMMPGQMQRTSQRKIVLFGQCLIVVGLGMWVGVSDQWWPFSHWRC